MRERRDSSVLVGVVRVDGDRARVDPRADDELVEARRDRGGAVDVGEVPVVVLALVPVRARAAAGDSALPFIWEVF